MRDVLREHSKVPMDVVARLYADREAAALAAAAASEPGESVDTAARRVRRVPLDRKATTGAPSNCAA